MEASTLIIAYLVGMFVGLASLILWFPYDRKV